MKRISLSSILLLSILCTFTQARDYGYVPLRYRTRWSPYTQSMVPGNVQYSPYNLEYKSKNMVYDNVYYSPYALKYNGNALVDHYVNYSPYLLEYNKSGLISDIRPGGYGLRILNVVHRNVPENQINETCISNDYHKYKQEIYEERKEERAENIENQKANLEKIKQQKSEDPSEAIREYLKSKNITFKTDRSLRIEGETVSVTFNIEDANIIIKFWNSKVITEFDENDKHKKEIFENYLESWEDYCVNNIGNSKKIYNIISGSKEELLLQLASDENLKSDDILYASAKN